MSNQSIVGNVTNSRRSSGQWHNTNTHTKNMAQKKTKEHSKEPQWGKKNITIAWISTTSRHREFCCLNTVFKQQNSLWCNLCRLAQKILLFTNTLSRRRRIRTSPWGCRERDAGHHPWKRTHPLSNHSKAGTKQIGGRSLCGTCVLFECSKSLQQKSEDDSWLVASKKTEYTQKMHKRYFTI